MKERVRVSHKTQYPFYRAEGFRFTREPQVVEVTAAQRERLEADKWLVVETVDGTGETGESGKPLGKMNKAELTQAATYLGIEVPEGATNKDIIDLIEKANAGTGEPSRDSSTPETTPQDAGGQSGTIPDGDNPV